MCLVPPRQQNDTSHSGQISTVQYSAVRVLSDSYCTVRQAGGLGQESERPSAAWVANVPIDIKLKMQQFPEANLIVVQLCRSMLDTLLTIAGYRNKNHALIVIRYHLYLLSHRGGGHVATRFGRLTMFTGATKIVKPEGQEPDEFEQTVAQELFNLEVCLTLSSAPY